MATVRLDDVMKAATANYGERTFMKGTDTKKDPPRIPTGVFVASHTGGLTEGDQYYTTVVEEKCCKPGETPTVPIPNSIFPLGTGIASIVGATKF